MIDHAYRNMFTKLKTVIHVEEVQNFHQLEYRAVRREEVFSAIRSYHPPPPPERFLDPELAYFLPRLAKPRAKATAYLAEDIYNCEYEEPVGLFNTSSSMLVNTSLRDFLLKKHKC